MNKHAEDDKLCWMYKGESNHVDKEEYLLGRSVDKSFEQSNDEGKEKKLKVLPKNHVEHECIPPSIRDFNKIVNEQVDLSAKLQEDPLVAIKKQEEEARRQFLQNPIQLKKLQDALKAEEKKKKRKKSKYSDNHTKGNGIGINLLKEKKKTKTHNLDTILMHKFNQLKGKLSQEDIDNILTGETSDSDIEMTKTKIMSKNSSSSIEKVSETEVDRSERSKYKYRHEEKRNSRTRRKSSEYYDDEREKKTKREQKQNRLKDKRIDSRERKLKHEKEESRTGKIRKRSSSSSDSSTNDEKEKISNKHGDNLDAMILEKLRMIRNSSQGNNKPEKSLEIQQTYYDSDNDEYVSKKKLFGLVQSDGTRIPLKHQITDAKKETSKSVKNVKPQPTKKNHTQKLSDKEKQKLREQMMVDAVKRDQERSDNLKKYRQEKTRDDNPVDTFDKNFVHRELSKSQKNMKDLESRIKSKLSNLQRSTQHMAP